MRWRIYYSDKEPYVGDPFLAPQTGVQAIAQEDPGASRGYRVIVGKDAFYWTPETGWRGCDEMGLWDYLMTFRGPKAVLFGRMARNEDYWATVRRAKNEGLG